MRRVLLCLQDAFRLKMAGPGKVEVKFFKIVVSNLPGLSTTVQPKFARIAS